MKNLIALFALFFLCGCANGRAIKFERFRNPKISDYDQMRVQELARLEEYKARDPEMAKRFENLEKADAKKQVIEVEIWGDEGL